MSDTIQSILVPTDGSDEAAAGARRAIDLAVTTGANLHVLSVIDSREIEPSLSSLDDGDRTEWEQRFEKEAKRAVETVAGLAMTHFSGRVTTAVERGIPFQMIAEYVETHGIDLIVMGTHGRSGLERFLLGSVTEKTLRSVSVPVVTVPPSADVIELGDSDYDDILLPTDGSEGAEIAVDWGITLAEMYDAMVHTIYSTDTGRFGSVDEIEEIHADLEQLGRDALESVRERAGAVGVSVAGKIGSGPAARMILSYSDEHDIDLIVMGTHGRSGINRYLIGSVTETVVRNADVPVCCVPMEGLE